MFTRNSKKESNRSPIQAIGIFLTFCLGIALTACVGIDMKIPKGEKGESAYEIWKGEVEKGSIQWDKEKLSLTDFFLYLTGKQGVNGESAYEQWREMVKKGEVEHPQKSGTKWDASKDKPADFWLFLTGAPGAPGVTPHIGENGNWFLGEKDTNIKAKGEDGAAGPAGTAGADGANVYDLWKKQVEAGTMPMPNDPNGKWPTDKNTQNDFWNFVRGGENGAEALKLEITKNEAKQAPATTAPEGATDTNTGAAGSTTGGSENSAPKDNSKWLLSIASEKGAVITLSNTKNKTTTHNVESEDGTIDIELDRDPTEDVSYIITATKAGRQAPTPRIITVQRQPMVKKFEFNLQKIYRIVPDTNGGGMKVDRSRVVTNEAYFLDTSDNSEFFVVHHDRSKGMLYVKLEYENVIDIEGVFVQTFSGGQHLEVDMDNQCLIIGGSRFVLTPNKWGAFTLKVTYKDMTVKRHKYWVYVTENGTVENNNGKYKPMG